MSDLAKRLDEYMCDEMVDNDEQRFQIKTPEQAEWALKKLRKIQEKEDEVHNLVDSEIHRLETFRKSELERFSEEKKFFESLLMEYHKPQYEMDPKGNKTLRFPSGKITFRRQQPNYIRKEDDLLNWVKSHKPEYVKIKESADWSSLKNECKVSGNKLVTPDGEIVEGVLVEERPDKFEVKLG